MDFFHLLGFALILSGTASRGLAQSTTPATPSSVEDTIANIKGAFQEQIMKIRENPELSSSLKRQKFSPNTASEVKDEYDFVIIGAGSAGSVLANRLSVTPCVTVLLLEAGHEPPILTEIPALERFNVHTDIDWDFDTVPLKRSGRNLNGRIMNYASGKVLGGSSTLNDVQYSRGNPADYDGWAGKGAVGWSFREIYKYFIKMEDNRDADIVANGYHGIGGPQTISRPGYAPKLQKHLYDAAKSLGIPVKDVNSDGYHQLGFYDLQGTERNGQMCSTAKGYLVPADSRTNLDIVINAFVRKIITKGNVATGVEYDYKGTTRTVSARKEVILSAGTINTPKILMLSGIGPGKELQKHNISVVVDLPGVGQNLQDHVGSSENFELNTTRRVALKLADPATLTTYINNRTGPLSSAQLVLTLAYLQNENQPRFDIIPDHLLYFVELDSILALLDFNLKPEVFAKIYLPYQDKPFYGCLCHLLHPKSRGSVTINSADPYDPPVIDPNYFEDPDDIKQIVSGLKNCRRVSETTPMLEIGAKRFTTLYPGCEKYAKNVDRYYACQVRSTPLTFYHYAGTAKMGNPYDFTTVVDPLLRVKGMRNLRVVDSSVMPTITTGNTNIPTIMIAEKASDLILSTYTCINYPSNIAVNVNVRNG